MPNPKHPIVITTKRTVSQQDISFILAAAMESGVYGSSWLRAYDAEPLYGTVEDETGEMVEREWIGFDITKPNGDGEVGEGNEVPAINTHIRITSMVEALEKLANDPEACKVHKGYQFNYDDYDAPAADIVVQVAVFGEVIYG